MVRNTCWSKVAYLMVPQEPETGRGQEQDLPPVIYFLQLGPCGLLTTARSAVHELHQWVNPLKKLASPIAPPAGNQPFNTSALFLEGERDFISKP